MVTVDTIFGKLEKVTEEKADKLETLRIALDGTWQRFNQNVLLMSGAGHNNNDSISQCFEATQYKEALERLSELEDDIKRFRENRKQAFEEY